MPYLNTPWPGSILFTNLFTALFFSGTLMLIRWLSERYIYQRTSRESHEQRLKAVGRLRNLTSMVLFIGLFYIWGDTIYSWAVSLFALALACVTATKELIICLHGYLLLMRGEFYRLGDRIEINRFRGDVVEIKWLSTTLLEVGFGPQGHYRTGRQITFPNSLLVLFNTVLINESTFDDATFMRIRIPVSYQENALEVRDDLLAAVAELALPIHEETREKIRQQEHIHGFNDEATQPQVTFECSNHEEIGVKLRVLCPSALREEYEQRLLQLFLTKQRLRENLKATPTISSA